MPKQDADKPSTHHDTKPEAEASEEVRTEGVDTKEADSEQVKPAKWQEQLNKEKEKQDKKEVEVDEAFDSQGQALRVNTRIIVNGEQRLVVKLTNKSVLSIPAEVTDANKNQSLEEVTLVHPVSEVTRY